jgi:inorganic pyrophosphatase
MPQTEPESAANQFPDIIEAVVEIPTGSRNKYEFDEHAGVYRLDRVLSAAVHYAFDYGFVDETRADDGDHTDIMLLIREPTFTGCHVWARPVAGLEMSDENGRDFKILCVAIADPQYRHIRDIGDVSEQRLLEIEHFFATYKLLEDKEVDVLGWRSRDEALAVLREDRERWTREGRVPVERTMRSTPRVPAYLPQPGIGGQVAPTGEPATDGRTDGGPA